MATSGDNPDLVNLPDDIKVIIKDGKNSKALKCQRCPSLILKEMSGTFVHNDIFLPHMKKKSENQSPGDGERLTDFWKVNGMFTFENVGFSNTVDDTKYLICADCEVGPIGCQKLSEPNVMYVALDRVNHEDE